MKSKDIIYAIENINEDLYSEGEFYEIYFDYSTNGYSENVTFLGAEIWNSEFDTRIYDEQSNTYEEMETCLRREALKVIKEAEKLKTKL